MELMILAAVVATALSIWHYSKCQLTILCNGEVVFKDTVRSLSFPHYMLHVDRGYYTLEHKSSRDIVVTLVKMEGFSYATVIYGDGTYEYSNNSGRFTLLC